MTLKTLLIIATLAGFSMGFDEVIVTTILVGAPKIQIKCKDANLTIDGKAFAATFLTVGAGCLFEPTATQTIPVTNAPIWLRLDPLNAVEPFTGLFSVDQTAAVNTLQSGSVVLQEESAATRTKEKAKTEETVGKEKSNATTTTRTPHTVTPRGSMINGNATLTINYIRFQYDDVTQEANKNNWAAVTVAIIEALFLYLI